MSHHRELMTGQIACITFAEPALLAAFQRDLGLDIPLFGDPNRATYEAFGFGRGSVRRVWLDPRVWLSYARLLARGRRTSIYRQDTLQLGGDVVLDRAGVVRWISRGAGPDDRPAVATVAAQLRAASGPAG